MRDVRICLDQNMTSEQLLQDDDVDTLALDDIVRSKILEAVVRVHSNAPTYLLEEGHNFGDAVFWGDLESGWVLLPQDFMRLIVFEMSDWERAVFLAISPTDPEYALQRQRIARHRPKAGVRNNLTARRQSVGVLLLQKRASLCAPGAISSIPENRQGRGHRHL